MWVIAIYYYAKANPKLEEIKEEILEPTKKPKKIIKNKQFLTRRNT